MGFDLMLIATNANGLKIPQSAKCCVCNSLLDDGVCLSGCFHNACFKCMKSRAAVTPKCPLDSVSFDPKQCGHVSDEVEEWLRNIKLKCKWFDGRACVATGISIRNAHRHEDVCPNNPKNKQQQQQQMPSMPQHITGEQRDAIRMVSKFMDVNEFADNKCGLFAKTEQSSSSSSGSSLQQITGASVSTREEWVMEWKPRKNTSLRPKQREMQKTRSRYHFRSEKSSNPEVDLNWRK